MKKIKNKLNMSIKFHNEYYIAFEGKDLQANAMAVDRTGTFVLLAGRRCIAIRNLLDESDTVQKYPRQSKYDVTCAEWNPTVVNKELCVISSNQRLEVLTWRPEELTQTYSLRAHTRVITDLNWHQFDPNILASCSVDTFIHIWDIRDPRRPAVPLSAIAEASQVRWNKQCPHLLATAHYGDIKIWDQRKGTTPVQYISAHVAKIHGLDWSPDSEQIIASSSQDCTVKFFDIANPRNAESVLSTTAPVWRARFTPFGSGLVTVVLPQLRRGENSLLLWNTLNPTKAVHTFVGHRDVVLEFQWRSRERDDNQGDFQLITWSKDQTLLVWKIEPYLQKLCGYEDGGVSEEEDSDDSFAGRSEGVDEVGMGQKRVGQALQQEFSLLNVQIPNLEVRKMDHVTRTCVVKAQVNNFTVSLQVQFPFDYPHSVPPVFTLEVSSTTFPNSNYNETIANQLLQTLNHLASQRVLKNRTCLEPCLRHMVSTLDQLSTTDLEIDRMPDFELPGNATTGGYNDAYIPFPRTSGAKFCSVGTLVCFGRPIISTRKVQNKLEPTTPRALSALESILAKRLNEQMTVSAYYYQRQRSRAKNAKSKTHVHIYDASRLFYVDRQLADVYILDGDVGAVCKFNADKAMDVGRLDLVQAWTLVSLVAEQLSDKDGLDWKWGIPLGNGLMESLISHYAQQADVQMAAMLSCVYGKMQNSLPIKQTKPKGQLVPSKRWFKSGGSPYHTIPPADVVAEGWVLPSISKCIRSNSLDNIRVEEVLPPPIESTFLVLSPAQHLYEYYKLAYAETLHRWGLLYKRAEIVKYMRQPPEPHKGVEFLPECKVCNKPAKSCCCTSCKRLSFCCTVCHISVRGAANCCILCGHGGHTKHLRDWFQVKNICPTGCGCHCIVDSVGIFND